MSTEETRQDTYGARHWASAYIAYIAGLVLTACSYLTNAFGLHEHGLTAGVLLGGAARDAAGRDLPVLS